MCFGTVLQMARYSICFSAMYARMVTRLNSCVIVFLCHMTNQRRNQVENLVYIVYMVGRHWEDPKHTQYSTVRAVTKESVPPLFFFLSEFRNFGNEQVFLNPISNYSFFSDILCCWEKGKDKKKGGGTLSLLAALRQCAGSDIWLIESAIRTIMIPYRR